MKRKQVWPDPPPGYSLWTYLCTVTRIYDGDGLTVQIDRGWHTVTTMRLRFAAVDAPELDDEDLAVRARAVLARDRVRALLPVGGMCIAVTSKPVHDDQYGRFLARVFVPGGPMAGQEIGALLLAEGLAVPYGGGRRGPVEPTPEPASSTSRATAAAREGSP